MMAMTESFELHRPADLDRTLEQTPHLVERLRAGDAEAGALLNRVYREALVRFCWGYLGSLDQAEDAVQDICFKVLSASEVPDRFRSWLYRIARNHCVNLLRDRATRKDDRRLPSASMPADTLTGHLTRLVKDEARSRLLELVASLSDAQREVLRLRYVEDLSRSEIAEVLGVPESVIKSRLFEGLKRLRDSNASFGPDAS